MNKKEKAYLEKIYFNPKFSTSFTGPDKLYRYIKKEGKFAISRKNIQKWIQTQEVYTTNRLIKHKIKRPRVIAPFIDYMWDADTASLKDYSKDNKGYGYFVLAIDILSRFVWTQAVKSPSGNEAKKFFHGIFQSGRKPLHLRTDKGTEFCNKVIEKYFKDNKINHFVTQNEVKANYAERAIQTFKSKIYRYIRKNQSFQWVEKLHEITEGYNNTFHRSIKRTPASVTKENENELWEQLYQPPPLPLKQRKKLFKFDIGDYVRISKLRKAFQRYYSEHWTNEVFIVKFRKITQDIPLYILDDYDHDPIEGVFYEEELQKIYFDENTKYNIEEVEETKKINRKNYSFVKWKGWPRKFNTWILTSTIEDYK